MLKAIVVLLLALANLPKITCQGSCVPEWGQCGGIGYSGGTVCCSPTTCQVGNPYYSQCLKGTTTTTAQPPTTTAKPTTTTVKPTTTTAKPSTTTAKPTTTTAKPTTTTAKPTTTTANPTTTTAKPSTTSASTPSSTTAQSQTCQALYTQCGGIGWNGGKTCCTGANCVYGNDYYHQCLPSGNPTSSTPASASSSSSTTPAGNDGRQPGVTTRYWDCCKASCAWPGKATVSSPVRTCSSDGITAVDPNAASICNGGGAAMCNNQQPWNVSSTLSYGYAAANIAGSNENGWCCACYSLVFTSGPVAGKEMIVQVTNTGSDLGGNHFDLQMPGGGVGIFDGCSKQFPGPYSWGQQYGGVSSQSDCANLPPQLKSGCEWRFKWFQNADNPTMRFKPVTCPSVLTANTGCVRP